MELQPASMRQVRRQRDGRMVDIDADVGNVVAQLHELDSRLRVRFAETGGYFVVYEQLEDGKEHLVLTSQTLDARIVERVRQISSPSYDYAAELERQDAAADREADRRLHERVGPIAEEFMHAARRDRGLQTDRAFIPKGTA